MPAKIMKIKHSFLAASAAVAVLTIGFSLASWMPVSTIAYAQEVERITDGPRVKHVSENAAEISWSTTAAGSSVVHYGVRPDALSEIAEQPWGGTHEPNGDFNHTVWVKNLRPNTRYFFVVVSGQGRGTGTGSMSRVQEFRTER
jgi:hypothetical protein